VVLALGVPDELRAVEVHIAQAAGGVTLRFVVEMRRTRITALAPAVMAWARTLSPNSTTATKLLPLVPYHFLVFG